MTKSVNKANNFLALKYMEGVGVLGNIIEYRTTNLNAYPQSSSSNKIISTAL